MCRQTSCSGAQNFSSRAGVHTLKACERAREDSGPPRVDTRACWPVGCAQLLLQLEVRSPGRPQRRSKRHCFTNARPNLPHRLVRGVRDRQAKVCACTAGLSCGGQGRSALGPAQFRRSGAAFCGKQSRDVALVGVGCGETRRCALWRSAGASKGKGRAFGGCMDSESVRIMSQVLKWPCLK